jgi:putative Ca2+/H+ antiporter (TMEM165/GDT1 family)
LSWQGPTQLLLLAYSTVLAGELIGDRSIFTVASLTLRFRPAATFCGVLAAFMGKMGVAVLCGRLLAQLPTRWTSGLSAATLLATALWVWIAKEKPPPRADLPVPWRSAVPVAFSAIFFTEWGDPGQIAAAALAAGSNQPGLVWAGGTLALCTKAALAMTLGVSLRKHVPDRFARTLASGSCLVLGLLSLREVLVS